jgi:hypothetical protein
VIVGGCCESESLIEREGVDDCGVREAGVHGHGERFIGGVRHAFVHARPSRHVQFVCICCVQPDAQLAYVRVKQAAQLTSAQVLRDTCCVRLEASQQKGS